MASLSPSEHLTPDDAKKAKRSLVFISCCTLIFATFDFAENTLLFLNLEIIVSQEKMVRVGQLSCMILIIVFVLRQLPSSIEKLAQNYFLRLEKIHKREITFAQEDMYGPHEPETSAQAHLDVIKSDLNFQRSRKQTQFNSLIFTATALNIAIVDIVLPISLGVVATYNPYFVDEAVRNQFFRRI
ncbi:hypothetical protein GGR95_001154 [Sulfitobacter undariae]|uniref:Uncharacterized protein n=1 Tax=Sulfitobacter undariae TaxID=1563671 RepID=A0A7W6GZ45_9RHOB|nr:hypothetical protein [Sulfitobacter undariae]MBB3993526.1 hypothetical protein [Sulfitobacter undariae]